jgi:hypothetical protein
LKADPSPTEYSKAVVEVSAARVALANGDAARAVALAEHAVQMFTTATPTRGGLVQAQIFYARALNGSGRFHDAAAAADEGVRLARARLGDLTHSSFTGQALLEVATAKQGLGDIKGARAAVAAAIEHLNAAIGERSGDLHRAEALQRSL